MKVVVQNLAVEYEDNGSGPVMVFLHGWKDNLHTFDRLIAQLSKKWRTIAVDMPGFGKSEVPTQPWDLDAYIRWTKAFIEKLDIQPSVLVGHSFGARVAIKGVATGALSTEKLVLIGAAGIAKQASMRNRLVTAAAKVGKYLTLIPPFIFWRQKIRTALYGHVGSDYLGAGGLKKTYLNIIKEDLKAQAQLLTVPTLLIWGANDTQTPLADGKVYKELIKEEGAGANI